MQSTTIVAPKVSRAVGVAATAIGGYTPAGATGAIVTSLVCANITAGQILVTVDLFDGTNATRLALATPVAVGDSLMVGGADAKFTLVNGWSIRVTSNTAASVDASMCVTEFT
jgi:hypothetical protein